MKKPWRWRYKRATCKAFPQKHWTRIYSTNPLELLNKEIKRRTIVVGMFLDQPSVIHLAGSILMRINDKWQVAERRYFSLETMRELTHPEVLMEDLGPVEIGANLLKKKKHRLTHWSVQVLLHH